MQAGIKDIRCEQNRKLSGRIIGREDERYESAGMLLCVYVYVYVYVCVCVCVFEVPSQSTDGDFECVTSRASEYYGSHIIRSTL